jgi:hypothetical protein
MTVLLSRCFAAPAQDIFVNIRLVLPPSHSADIQSDGMKSMKTIFLVTCFAAVMPFAVAQTKAPKKLTTAEAKDHVGETVMVCGKAVDTKIPRYAIGGRGKPVEVDLDQPQPNPIFYFVTFGADPKKPQDVATMYVGKEVCVTGSLSVANAVTFIVVDDSKDIKIQK